MATITSREQLRRRPRGALPQGAATMSPGMSSASRYARYLFDAMAPWLTAPVLEVGSGYGTYTGYLLERGPVLATDIDYASLQAIEQRFAGRDLTARFIDLNDPGTVRACRPFQARSIFCSNVLEHIEDDVGALAALRDASATGCHACILVPAFEALYGYMDAQAGHFRRYTRRTLERSLADAGWTPVRSFYLNAIGGLGWWVNNRLLPAKPLDAPRINNQLLFYDRFIVPVSRVVDRACRPWFGMSVVAIGRNDRTA